MFQWTIWVDVVFGKCNRRDYNKDHFQMEIYDDITVMCDTAAYADLIYIADTPRHDEAQVKVYDDYQLKFERWKEDYPVVRGMKLNDVTCRIDVLFYGPHKESPRPAHLPKKVNLIKLPFMKLVDSTYILKKNGHSRSGPIYPNSLDADPYNRLWSRREVSLVTPWSPISSVFEIICYEDSPLEMLYDPTSRKFNDVIAEGFAVRRPTLFDANQLAHLAINHIANIVQFIYIWKPKPKVRNKRKKPHVIVYQLESTSYLDLFRTANMKNSLECDGFIILENASTIGGFTRPNQVGMEHGHRDIHYAHSALSLKARYDESKAREPTNIARSEGYISYIVTELNKFSEWFSRGGTRAGSTVDGRFFVEAARESKAVIHGNTQKYSFECDMARNEPAVMSHIRAVVDMLSKRDEPLYARISIDSGSHDGYNNTFQGYAIEQLMNSEAREILLEETFLIFFGDHGHRIFMHQQQEYRSISEEDKHIEKYRPLISIRIPNKWAKEYPNLEKMIKSNIDKLTSVLDIHETIRDILTGRFLTDDNVYLAPTLSHFPAFEISNWEKKVDGVGFQDTHAYSDTRYHFQTESVITGRQPVGFQLTKSPMVLYRAKAGRKNHKFRNLQIPQTCRHMTEAPALHAWGFAGISLFKQISYDRTCDVAGIGSQYCSCYGDELKVYASGMPISELTRRQESLDERETFHINRVLQYDDIVKDAIMQNKLPKNCILMFVGAMKSAMNAVNKKLDSLRDSCRIYEAANEGALITNLTLLAANNKDDSELYEISFIADWLTQYYITVKLLNGATCVHNMISPIEPRDIEISNALRLDRYEVVAYCLPDKTTNRDLCYCKGSPVASH